MEYLDGILKLTDHELGAIVQNGKYRSREEVDSVYKLIDIAKDIYCIWKYEEDSGDMSYDGHMYRGGSYEGSYDGDMSYARGRGRNARRDSMGRYARDGGYSNRTYRGYSRGGKDEYIEQLRGMMDEAPDEQTRQSIQRMIQQMENS